MNPSFISSDNRLTLEEPLSDFILMGVTSVVLGIMILITVIGNVFVIAAILLERNLQNVANYLIVSLAVADLMVACLVMPLGAVYEISRGWILGPELCDMWTSSDVLCCTASILHLVAIAVDRYWAVTNVDYIHTRNGTRIVTMIVVVWSVALVVSLAPQFGWKDPDYLDRINIQQRCLVSQDIGYQIFATCSTFYVPLLVILVLYWKIFQTARKRIRRRRQQRNAVLETTKVNLAPATGSSTTQSTGTSKSHKTLHFFTKNRFIKMRRCRNKSDDPQQQAALVLIEGHSQSQSTDEVLQEEENSHHELNIKDIDESEVDKNNELNIATNTTDNAQTTAFTISNHMTTTTNQINTPVNVSPEKSSGATATTNNGSAGHQPNDQQMRCSTITTTPQQKTQQPISHIDKPVHQPTKRDLKKESLEAKRERKAAKTLAIITGAFVVCWLPFFIMALLMPLCDACYINDYLSSFFLWLGYFNSTLNPVIYTIFSPEFRQAFKRMLCGVSHNRNRGRKLR
ncbi:5-hydroxytryptamine receptor-like [Lycorma delicatula]|uniref:5-hydroxytryptamine receptor-like n=1 Tax=Lycorma delicatula TaxID=130591 RepID=UPI003F51A0CF